ncbi:MAG: transglutaminase domain-containing protein [Spirochaetales bacterium]|nr:transglutaminase domain-containing protein [Spirochaetales bacterium]
MRNVNRTVLFLILIVLAASLTACRTSSVSYLQDPEEIYIMEAGILRSQLELGDGEDIVLGYDFDNPEYPELIAKYGIDRIAGSGSELERALRLMDEFSRRLKHESFFDNHVEMNALALLEYSLDKPSHGINCRSKAQILNEMCLALGIAARKVWIMPLSPYDNDCHVVNEVWDTELGKWVMLDITNNEYWIDENGTPLSILEIREKGARNELCTPVYATESTANPARLKEKHMGDFLYIMKNMVYTEYLDTYTVGENASIYILFPKNLKTKYDKIISQASVERAPF